MSFVDYDLITCLLLLIHPLFCLALLGFNWSLFCFHYVAYVALIYFIPPQVLLTCLSPWIETWNVTFVGSFYFHLSCFIFFIVYTISGLHHLHHSNQLQLTLHPFPDQSTTTPIFSSFMSTFQRARNLSPAWPPCPRQPRHTRSYCLARRRVHACPEANTL